MQLFPKGIIPITLIHLFDNYRAFSFFSCHKKKNIFLKKAKKPDDAFLALTSSGSIMKAVPICIYNNLKKPLSILQGFLYPFQERIDARRELLYLPNLRLDHT